MNRSVLHLETNQMQVMFELYINKLFLFNFYKCVIIFVRILNSGIYCHYDNVTAIM